MKILVLAPHPDDEVLGCGGTIAKFASKKHYVHLCVVTKPYQPDWSKKFIEQRPKEITKSSQILGIKKVSFLNFPTVKLDTVPQKELNEAIGQVIKQFNPDEVYIPHIGDINKDHRLVAEAALVALRPGRKTIKRVLAYETLSETEWGQEIEVFTPNVFVDIKEFFNKKIKAMKSYQSEVKSPPHPRSIQIIEALAKKRGSEAGLKMAEAFKLIREID
jgi:LmbE family N-acetylglucosaminyl deacetylase